MRRIAAVLDTGPASLYVYVTNREGLLRAMQDRIFAMVEAEPVDPPRWREQLHALLGRLRAALAGHPGMAMTTMALSPRGEASLRLAEAQLGLLLAGGLAPRDAAWALDVLATLVIHAAAEAEARPVSHHDDQAEDCGSTSSANRQGLSRCSPPMPTCWSRETPTSGSGLRWTPWSTGSWHGRQRAARPDHRQPGPAPGRRRAPPRSLRHQ